MDLTDLHDVEFKLVLEDFNNVIELQYKGYTNKGVLTRDVLISLTPKQLKNLFKVMENEDVIKL